MGCFFLSYFNSLINHSFVNVSEANLLSKKLDIDGSQRFAGGQRPPFRQLLTEKRLLVSLVGTE